MAAVPQMRSAREVIDWYSDQDECAWELFRFQAVAKNRQALYHGKDKNDGAEKLSAELNRIHPDDCENYVIVLGSIKGSKEKTFEPLYSRVFVANEKPYGVPVVAGVGISPQQQQINNEILAEIRALRAERLAEVEEDEIEEEEQTPSSILAGMLQQPHVQQMLITAVTNLAGSFIKPKVQHVAGIETDSDLDQIIDVLFSKGVTTDDLKKLSEMPETQIKMLLTMLRK